MGLSMQIRSMRMPCEPITLRPSHQAPIAVRPMRQHLVVEGVLLCRYKMTSRKFLTTKLRSVRSIVPYRDVCTTSGATELLRRLLWAEPLDSAVFSPEPLQSALRSLARDGQVIIVEDR